MPLLLSKQIDERSMYALWNIQENYSELSDLSIESCPKASNHLRRAEWLAARMLIKHLADVWNVRYNGITQNEAGKPFLRGSKAHISISHSYPLAAAMIHMSASCGIDIEKRRRNYQGVMKKYLHFSELEHSEDLKKLCAIWCAKEVLYKIEGRRYVSFKDEMKVSFLSDKLMRGEILKKENKSIHTIHYEWVKEHFLAFGI